MSEPLPQKVSGLFFDSRFWLVAAVLWTTGVFALALSPTLQAGWLAQTVGDKGLHGLAFFCGGIVWGKTVQITSGRKNFLSAVAGGLISLFIGILVEAAQRLVPGRSPDPEDIAADVAGVLLAFFVLSAMLTNRRVRNKS